ncbi:MAG TPA: amidohydrolase [Williamwhitmania sp.]|nr:amidohydrolase [Williamwhitmania sp.]
MEELKRLRHELHKNPELSNQESGTALRLKFFLSRYRPDELVQNVGGEGLLAVYNGLEPGPTVLFRADMDALPITEINKLPYSSSKKGVGHMCGHDGHMTILSGLAMQLHSKPPQRGRAMLLFQPAEETGEGAARALADMIRQGYSPDYAFALHNMPRYPLGSLLLSREVFAAASKGLVVKLTGHSSHAAEPEKGISPALAVARTIEGLIHLSKSAPGFEDYILLTVIYARLGEIAFGTTPGYAEVMATLRSFKNEDMALLTKLSEEIVRKVAAEQHLKADISYVEEFPAAVNSSDAIAYVEKAANQASIPIVELVKPNGWSEDFAHFCLHCKSAIFGLGSGVDHPELHRPDYDFPDEIIEPGVNLFHGIVRQLLG